MTRGEEDYQDKVHPLVHIVKYAFDLLPLYLSVVSPELISKKLQNKKRWFVDEEETNQYFQATFNHQ